MRMPFLQLLSQKIATYLWILLFCLSAAGPGKLSAQNLRDRLEQIPQVASTTELTDNQHFTEVAELRFLQPKSHSKTDSGTFKQRVFIFHRDYQAPVVLVTEGYQANYVFRSGYYEELSQLLQANLVVVEHRYFGESLPENRDFAHFSTREAAADHHAVRQALGQLYPSSWLASGISKGGQAALFYRMYYPEDVSGTVAYVAPINFALEEDRHSHFIQQEVATRRDRKKVYRFQKQLLRKKEALLPYLQDQIDDDELHFRVPVSEIYDLCVLEYAFSFWQWVGQPILIPPKKAGLSQIFEHFNDFSKPHYFAIDSSTRFTPFFVQAAQELGYYGYDRRKFKRWIPEGSVSHYLQRVFLGPERQYPYSPATSQQLDHYLRTEADHVLFIYGGLDPWTASGFSAPDRENFRIVVDPTGTHATRIANLSPDLQKELKKMLQSWIQN